MSLTGAGPGYERSGRGIPSYAEPTVDPLRQNLQLSRTLPNTDATTTEVEPRVQDALAVAHEVGDAGDDDAP